MCRQGSSDESGKKKKKAGKKKEETEPTEEEVVLEISQFRGCVHMKCKFSVSSPSATTSLHGLALATYTMHAPFHFGPAFEVDLGATSCPMPHISEGAVHPVEHART